MVYCHVLLDLSLYQPSVANRHLPIQLSCSDLRSGVINETGSLPGTYTGGHPASLLIIKVAKRPSMGSIDPLFAPRTAQARTARPASPAPPACHTRPASRSVPYTSTIRGCLHWCGSSCMSKSCFNGRVNFVMVGLSRL